jgi:hypothetical protein
MRTASFKKSRENLILCQNWNLSIDLLVYASWSVFSFCSVLVVMSVAGSVPTTKTQEPPPSSRTQYLLFPV